MTDISKCSGKDCNIKDQCYRYTASADNIFQSYIAPQIEDGKCESFLGINQDNIMNE